MAIDPTILGGAVAAFLAMDPVKRLLGPTADYLGKELAAYTERRRNRAQNIVAAAAEMIPENAPPDASVSSRVLLESLDEGSKIESEIAEKYFAGVLASSLSKKGEDDSAVTFTSLLASMSSSQMTAHCVLYSALFVKWNGSGEEMSGDEGRSRLQSALTLGTYKNAGGSIDNLERDLFGLYRLGLISNFSYGAFMTTPIGLEQYVKFIPSVLGAQLFLAANGHPATSASDIVNSKLTLRRGLIVTKENVWATGDLVTAEDPRKIAK